MSCFFSSVVLAENNSEFKNVRTLVYVFKQHDALNSSLFTQEIKGMVPGILITLFIENKGTFAAKINLDKSITVDTVLAKGPKIKSLEKFQPNLYSDSEVGDAVVNQKVYFILLSNLILKMFQNLMKMLKIFPLPFLQTKLCIFLMIVKINKYSVK